MDLISAQKIVTRTGYYGRRSILQSGNREWIIATESICLDIYSFPPYIAFQNKIYINSSFDNLPINRRFEVCANGWIIDETDLR